jgi:sugar phosphate isomerase/epimerase
MTYRVGISTLVCGGISFADALGRINTAGFEFVEVHGVHFSPADMVGRPAQVSNDLLTACRRAHITPISFSGDTSGSLQEQTVQVRALAEVAVSTGMKVITLMAAQVDVPITDDIARFRQLTEAVRDLDVTLSLNTHVDTLSEDPNAALRYVEEVPQLGITLDPAHYLVGPYWNGAVRALFPYVRSTQLKASGRRRQDLQLPVDESEIDIPAFVSDLSAAGYRGDLVIEYYDMGEDPTAFDCLSEARKLHKLLEGAA